MSECNCSTNLQKIISKNIRCSITRDVDLVDVYQLRTYDALDSPSVSVINDCSFFKILQRFAVEAGFTLSTLYKMDKIRDVREQIGNQGNIPFGYLMLLLHFRFVLFQTISTKHSFNYYSINCLNRLNRP